MTKRTLAYNLGISVLLASGSVAFLRWLHPAIFGVAVYSGLLALMVLALTAWLFLEE